MSTEMMTADQANAIRIALKNSLYPGAKDESVDMVLAYCKAARLDPMTKPVHIVPMRVRVAKDRHEWRDVVMPGIELYRTKAHDTGEYAGQDEVEFGPTKTLKVGDTSVDYPEWAKVTVYRLVNGARVPYMAKVYWVESYATAGGDTALPNAMWRKRPFGQVEKCAEALALRKAFPEAIGAHNTVEEMDGREIDISGAEDPRQPVAQPQSKSAKARAEEPPIDAEIVPPKQEQQPEPQQAKAEEAKALPSPLSDGMRKILSTKLAAANLNDAALQAGFGDVTAANINQALKWIAEQKS